MQIKRYTTKMGDEWSAVVELHRVELFGQNRFVLRRVDEGQGAPLEVAIEVLPEGATKHEAAFYCCHVTYYHTFSNYRR